ncbi:uncharacterized protein BO97DRAFT_309344, partial [Aspergillus homomorphus CBS 101889]
APWSTDLKSHLSQSKTKSFTLSTITLDPRTNAPAPRSRTCELRGFFPEVLSLHPSAIEALNTQQIGLNPEGFESDMPVFTTDARMAKIGEFAGSGAQVEAVFWLAEVGVQWRVRGGVSVFGGGEDTEAEREGRGVVWGGVRVKESDGPGVVDGNKGDWSWERMVTTYFASHSPVMRGSFRNPPPGAPRSKDPQNPDLKIGQKVQDLRDPVARNNFRVVVIRPEEVEMLDLSNAPDAVRKRWTAVGDGAEGTSWEEIELWP